MNVPELALHHQRLDQRAGSLHLQIERVRGQLATDPVAERLEQDTAAAETARRDLDLRLRDREREVEDRRTRLRGRQRELMSGRIRNPTELMKLNEEVEHLKTALSDEEDATLELMEEQERMAADMAQLATALTAARERTAAAAPGLRERQEQLEREVTEVESERDETWQQLPPQWQEAYRRVASRQSDPVAQVVGGQCQACRVTMTSSGAQALRRGALVHCENCGRILVQS